MAKFGIFLFILILVSMSDGGPAAYAACQSGCNTVAVACYAVSIRIIKLNKLILINFKFFLFFSSGWWNDFWSWCITFMWYSIRYLHGWMRSLTSYTFLKSSSFFFIWWLLSFNIFKHSTNKIKIQIFSKSYFSNFYIQIKLNKIPLFWIKNKFSLFFKNKFNFFSIFQILEYFYS